MMATHQSEYGRRLLLARPRQIQGSWADSSGAQGPAFLGLFSPWFLLWAEWIMKEVIMSTNCSLIT